MPIRLLPRLQILIAALLFSTGGVAVKSCSLSSWQIACFRCVVAAVAMFVILPAARKRWTAATLGVGFFYAGTLTLFVLANKTTTAMSAVFLQSTAPLYILLLGPLLLGERPRQRDALVMVGMATGLVFFFLGEQASFETAPAPLLGNVLGALSGLCWALTIMGLRWLERHVGGGQGAPSVVAGSVLAALISLPFVATSGATLADGTPSDWLLILYLGVFQIAIAYVLLTKAVASVPAFEASLLILVEPMFNPVWAYLVHGEVPGSWSIAGGILILAVTITKSVWDARRPMLGICRLRNQIQLYDWGSRTALAELLGRPSPAPEPEAELWMGAHSKAPSEVWVDGGWVSLPELVSERAEEIFGPSTSGTSSGGIMMSEFPYLLKILAVERPLSIQTHPDRQQAIEGYRREEDAGLDRDAYERNYRDDQPKPEIIYALTPFWMLRGFRPAAEIVGLVRRFGMADFLPVSGQIESLFRAWMGLKGKRLEAALDVLLTRCRQLEPERDVEADWILRLAQTYPGDRGVLAPLFMHLHRLEPGETVYTGPGVLHAYLEGLGAELMTSSDNVVRGGLTAKHCDVPELLRLLRFEADAPRALTAEDDKDGVRRFEVPDAGLVLSVLELKGGRAVMSEDGRGVEVLLCSEGSGRVITDSGTSIEIGRGDSFLAPVSAGRYRLEGSCRLFRAGISNSPG